MQGSTIDRLRELRRTAISLNATVPDDLKQFLQDNAKTFRRLPDSNRGRVNVTTTCTVFMALAACDKWRNVLTKHGTIVTEAFRPLTEVAWTSSGLLEGNPFTKVLVLRTLGFLAKLARSDAGELLGLKKKWEDVEKEQTLEQVAIDLVAEACKGIECFRLDSTLRENPALGYWLIDALDKLGLAVSRDVPKEFWRVLASWAAQEFGRQHSLVVARHDIMMDPIAMTMAACLAERLRSIADRHLEADIASHVKLLLPSRVELIHSIELVFTLQQPSGIWDKFFPMFYYREDERNRDREPGDTLHRGGANYCFAFEFLEALLNEFGSEMIGHEKIVSGLESACTWCSGNRLTYNSNGAEYCGWNSGQQVDSLSRGEPESWATGVVHMFLQSLQSVLSETIQDRILHEYGGRVRYWRHPSTGAWDRFLDSPLPTTDEQRATVKKLLATEIVDRISAGPSGAGNQGTSSRMPREQTKLNHRRSALLFGPPGTSKTSLVEAIAERIGWTYLEITPSDFLRKGLEQIYVQANEIFDDLMDLSRVVILFDEMDALVQRRGGEDREHKQGIPIDVTRQFLTTSMLPKLAKLHKQGRVVFFMATNHQDSFDPAIKRPGRFDLLIPMGPPSWSEKLRGLKREWLAKEDPSDQDAVEKALIDWGQKDPKLGNMLARFTYGEMNEFFDYLRRSHSAHENLAEALRALEIMGLHDEVQEWFSTSITLREGSPAWVQFDTVDMKAFKVQ